MARLTDKVLVHLEPSLYSIVQREIMRDNVSASSYVRKIIVKYLEEQGLLTKDMLLELV